MIHYKLHYKVQNNIVYKNIILLMEVFYYHHDIIGIIIYNNTG